MNIDPKFLTPRETVIYKAGYSLWYEAKQEAQGLKKTAAIWLLIAAVSIIGNIIQFLGSLPK